MRRAFAGILAAFTVVVLLGAGSSCGGSNSDGPYVPRATGTLTFNEDIAPIIFGKCSACHRPDGGAPFDLLEYDDVVTRSRQIAVVTERINRVLREEDRRCILIGPGRWGSRDPWLGIPVEWPQISSARAIVETDFTDLQVEPSLGSHFFHNLTCFGVAFFCVHTHQKQGYINWDWLRRQRCIEDALDGGVRHLRLERPVQVLVDGSSGHGVIRET